VEFLFIPRLRICSTELCNTLQKPYNNLHRPSVTPSDLHNTWFNVIKRISILIINIHHSKGKTRLYPPTRLKNCALSPQITAYNWSNLGNPIFPFLRPAGINIPVTQRPSSRIKQRLRKEKKKTVSLSRRIVTLFWTRSSW